MKIIIRPRPVVFNPSHRSRSPLAHRYSRRPCSAHSHFPRRRRQAHLQRGGRSSSRTAGHCNASVALKPTPLGRVDLGYNNARATQMNMTRRCFVATASASLAASRPARIWAAIPFGLESSPITNSWGKARTTRIKVEEYEIFRGTEGRAYNHQPQLVSDQRKLYATWSMGVRNEEYPGQQMVLATSEDGGRSWSKPSVVAPYHTGKFGMSVVCSSGLRIHEGALIAYSGEWERNPLEQSPAVMNRDGNYTSPKCRTEARISRDLGRSWSDPTLIAPGLTNYMPPSPTSTGRLILPGNLTYAYTDDPAGLRGWRRSGIPGVPDDFVDTFMTSVVGKKSSRFLGTSDLFSEANFFQTGDGVIHMMMRNERSRFLGVTESRDDGETWSRPCLTGFTNCICRSDFGRLSDGRYFSMSCPKPRGEKPGGHFRPYELVAERTPAILAVSTDGVVFDRHYVIGDDREEGGEASSRTDELRGSPRIPGIAKVGRYGYPYFHSMGECGFVIYSKYKEDICVCRFPLSALD